MSPGISGLLVGSTVRELHGLSAGVGKPTMPAPVHGGGWSSLPLGPSEAAMWLPSMWLREVLGEQRLVGPVQAIFFFRPTPDGSRQVGSKAPD